MKRPTMNFTGHDFESMTRTIRTTFQTSKEAKALATALRCANESCGTPSQYIPTIVRIYLTLCQLPTSACLLVADNNDCPDPGNIKKTMSIILTRHAHPVDLIIALSGRVQDALIASGSLQEIGPWHRSVVAAAVAEHSCFVAIDSNHVRVTGCAFVKSISKECFLTPEPGGQSIMLGFPQPWLYLHGVMLESEVQGRGIELLFVEEVLGFVREMETAGGTLFLDCWHGNKKLRAIHEKAGLSFVAVVPENDYSIAVYSRPILETDEKKSAFKDTDSGSSA